MAKALLEKLVEIDARIVYLVAKPAIQERIFAAISKYKLLYGGGYGWMLAWASEEAMLRADGTPSPDAIDGARGAIGLLESFDEDSELYAQYQRLWLQHASTAGCVTPRPASYQGKGTSYCDADGDAAGLPASYSVGMIEGVLALARVFDADNNYMDAAFRSDPERIYAAVRAQGLEGYQGISGRVVLDQYADRLGFFRVMNMQLQQASEGTLCGQTLLNGQSMRFEGSLHPQLTTGTGCLLAVEAR